MRHGSRRAKGRRLQVRVAEALARAFGLTILAEKPTKPGIRNGARWVPEGERADLRVRVMGQPGADVGLCTKRAQDAVAIDGAWCYIECKNAQGVPETRLDRKFWNEGRLQKFFERAYRQAACGAVETTRDPLPIVIVSKNRWPMVVLIHADAIPSGKLADASVRPMLLWRQPTVVLLPFDRFVGLLDGARHATLKGQPTKS